MLESNAMNTELKKQPLFDLIVRKLQRITEKRSGLSEDDLMTVTQYIHGHLYGRVSSDQIGDTDFDESGEGAPSEALERLRQKTSLDEIARAVVDKEGSADMRAKGIGRREYEETIRSLLHYLEESKIP